MVIKSDNPFQPKYSFPFEEILVDGGYSGKHFTNQVEDICGIQIGGKV